MRDLDRIASRYAELRGRPVLKYPTSLMHRIEAYEEILDDLADMRQRKEKAADRKRVLQRAKKLQHELIGECASCGLELSKQLAGRTERK